MESSNKKQPLFWINPNTRINFPHFRIEWHKCEKYELLALCEVKQECRMIYKAGSNCVCLLHSKDFSIVHILYSDDADFTNIRLQKWLRENIRNAIMKGTKTNARNAIRDSDRLKVVTILKGIFPNARHRIFYTIYCNGGRDVQCSFWLVFFIP